MHLFPVSPSLAHSFPSSLPPERLFRPYSSSAYTTPNTMSKQIFYMRSKEREFRCLRLEPGCLLAVTQPSPARHGEAAW